MARTEHTVVVERPPEEVFAVLTDITHLPEWQAGAGAVRGLEGDLGVGSTYVQESKFLGKRLEATIEVTEFEPGRRFSLRTRTGPIPFRVRHTLEPAGGGGSTRLHVELDGEPGGVFKLAESLVMRKARRQVEADFATLKQLVEARSVTRRSEDPSVLDRS
jgi:uncharacterized protein YndB with AHSA1/START domain